MDDYISTEDAARKLGCHPSRVRQLASKGRIEGARKVGKLWIFPSELRIVPGKSGPAGVAGTRAS